MPELIIPGLKEGAFHKPTPGEKKSLTKGTTSDSRKTEKGRKLKEGADPMGTHHTDGGAGLG